MPGHLWVFSSESRVAAKEKPIFGNWHAGTNVTAQELILRGFRNQLGILILALKRQARGLHAYGVEETEKRNLKKRHRRNPIDCVVLLRWRFRLR